MNLIRFCTSHNSIVCIVSENWAKSLIIFEIYGQTHQSNFMARISMYQAFLSVQHAFSSLANYENYRCKRQIGIIFNYKAPTILTLELACKSNYFVQTLQTAHAAKKTTTTVHQMIFMDVDTPHTFCKQNIKDSILTADSFCRSNFYLMNVCGIFSSH